MTQRDKEILTAFAESSMNAALASRKLFLHRNSVVYHLQKVKEETGLDPYNLFHLAELLGWKRRDNNETNP